eukprot:TRINITY_DN56111_c0_g1_i1.p1 TRINITY_DN56111_c0_g1~~TRINITY_DN56111_c0_g1_i1.p1  ORF type:complete len:1255 (-),score=324.98 TRINITY_DN56111_c0_g1_i1:56-3319(-)
MAAQGYSDAGRWDSAVRLAEAALASRPGDTDALEILVRALVSMGETGRADVALDILAQSNEDAAAGLARSLAKGQGRAMSERYRWLAKAAGWGKMSERPLRELGELCLTLQREQEALQHLQTAFQQSGAASDSALMQTLAQLHVRLGRKEQALEIYRQGLSANAAGFTQYRPYSQLLLAEGRANQAAEVLKLGALQSPASEAASLYVTLADLQKSMGQSRDAIKSLESATSLDGDSVGAWQGLAAAFASPGELPQRIRVLRELVRLQPREAQWRLQLGEAILSLPSAERVCDDASLHFREALVLKPNLTNAMLGLARLTAERAAATGGAEAREEALKLFEQAAQADPSSAAALEGAGNARWSRCDFEVAAKWYEQLLKLQPDNATALCRSAVACLQCQRAEEALTKLRQAVRLQPSSQEASAWLGYAQLNRGFVEEATQTLRTIMRQPDESLQATSRLYWSLALLAGNDPSSSTRDTAVREAEVAAKELPALKRLLLLGRGTGSAAAMDVEASGLAATLPGASAQVRRLLGELLRLTQASATPSGGLGSNLSGSGTRPQASSPSSTASTTANPEAWRDSMQEGDPIEVYSKSAGRWIEAFVLSLRADKVVKVKYLIDGSWCEKALLRDSDSLRPRQSSGSIASIGGGSSHSGTSAFGRGGYTGTGGSIPSSAATPSSSSSAPAPGGYRAGPSRNLPPGIGHAVSAEPPNREPGSPKDRDRAAAQVRSRMSSLASDGNKSATPLVRGTTPPPAGAVPQRPVREGAGSKESPALAAQQADGGQRRQWTQPVPTSPAPVKPEAAPMPGAPAGMPRWLSLSMSELQFGKVIGSGGFGSVYRGTYRGKEVAIKKLHPEGGQVTPMQLEEFSKEVENLLNLRHSRLVSFIGAAFEHPALCMVTEFMPNGSLYELLHQAKKPITSPQRVNIVTQIAEGVDFLHGRSPPFVHRDLKSMNVVMDFALCCKLCDFGLTQSMEKTHISRRSNEGGSPRYMAPELFDAKGKITEKVDIWALGCLALEVITGRMPHEECSNIQQVMTKVLVDKIPPFHDLAGISVEVRALAELCLVFQPPQRIGADQFLEGMRAEGLRAR